MKGRQRFLRGYPDDPELARLVAAFERGDYATVREGAPSLAQGTPDEDVRRAALDLQRRIEPHPLGTLVFAGTAILLLFLVVWFYSHPIHP